MFLLAALPGKQEQANGIQDLICVLYRGGLALDDNAPGDSGLRINAVRFEGYRRFPDSSPELGSISGPENQGAPVHFVVDRKDIRVVLDPYSESPHGDAPQKLPAIAAAEFFDPVVLFINAHDAEPTPPLPAASRGASPQVPARRR